MSLSLSIRRPVAAVAVSLTALLGAALPAVMVAPAASAAAPAEESFVGFTEKSTLEVEGRGVVSSQQLLVDDGSAPAGAGTTYYVDSTAGDDALAGTSAETAWKTFANVNATELQPGDRLLLKAGSSWTAEGDSVAREAYDYTTWSGGVGTDVVGPDATALLAPKGSGTADRPIVLSSYGDGSAPELNGRGVVNDVVQLTNQEHWDVSNLEISNMTDGFDPSTFTPQRTSVRFPVRRTPRRATSVASTCRRRTPARFGATTSTTCSSATSAASCGRSAVLASTARSAPAASCSRGSRATRRPSRDSRTSRCTATHREHRVREPHLQAVLGHGHEPLPGPRPRLGRPSSRQGQRHRSHH